MASFPQHPEDAQPLGRILAKEIAVSTLVNVVFNVSFAVLLFDTAGSIPLWGRAGIALDLVPATFMPALMMTFGITLGIHRRIRLGLLEPTRYTLARLPLPRALPWRALTIALLATAIIPPPVVGLIALTNQEPWTWGGFVLFKLGFSVLHAALVTPFVVISAMRDDR